MSTRAVRVVAAGLLCVGLSGCILVSDNTSARSPTVGQELRDLKVAKDEGAIEEEQYCEARQKLLARLDKPSGK